MSRVIAKELLELSYDEIWDSLNNNDLYTLVCEDGEVELTGRELAVSSYLWHPIRLYPKAPILTKHTLGSYNRTKGELLSLKAEVAYHVKDYYESLGTPIDFEELGFEMKRHDDVMYNDISAQSAAAVSTLSALDYRQVYYHPEIVKIREKLQSYDFTKEGTLLNSEMYVEEAYSAAKKVLMAKDDPLLQDCRLYHLCRSKQIPVMQIIKQVIAIGHGCDMNSRVFPPPIVDNYSRGVRKLQNAGIDAKSGSRSLAYQADPLEQTEYANRESQILADIVTELVDEDCGTDRLIPWNVTAANVYGMQGMYYKLENSPDEELKCVGKNDTHLVGKTVYLRNAITCDTKVSHGICKVCYGRLSEQLPRRSSIGRVGIFILSSDVSQKVLSLKHDGGTATSKKILFSEEDSEYVYSHSGSQSIFLRLIEGAKSIKINIPRKYIENIGYIHRINKIERLELGTISDIKDFSVEVEDEDGDIINRNINVALSARTSNLTHGFLRYIRDSNYQINQNNMIIDLSEWDFSRPILSVPRKHYSMLDFLAEFKKEVQNTDPAKNNLDLSVLSNISLALNNFNDLVAGKFFINLTHLCVTMRASISHDPSKGDFRLMYGPNARFGKFKQLVSGRSIATGFCHENITSFIYNIRSFDGSYKQFHPYDNIVLGDE